jgi:Tfp pilus assembly protein PilF
MSAKMRAMVSAVLFCALLFLGCQATNSAGVSQGSRTAADIRRAELQRELDKKWENPNALFELGQSYHAAGDWSKADWYYNNAYSFDPTRRDIQAARVKLQFDKGDKSMGDKLASDYMVQAASSPEQLLALGVAFEKQGLDAYALKCYQDALKTTPDSPTVNRQLGYYYMAKNKKDLAKEYFIRSFQLNPNQPDVAGELGRLGVAVKIPEPAAPVPEKLSQPVKPASQPK